MLGNSLPPVRSSRFIVLISSSWHYPAAFSLGRGPSCAGTSNSTPLPLPLSSASSAVDSGIGDTEDWLELLRGRGGCWGAARGWETGKILPNKWPRAIGPAGLSSRRGRARIRVACSGVTSGWGASSVFFESTYTCDKSANLTSSSSEARLW